MSVGELSVREVTILVFFMNNVVLNALNTSSYSWKKYKWLPVGRGGFIYIENPIGSHKGGIGGV